MKTQMEELEDDLAAEEENKLINEVRLGIYVVVPFHISVFASRNIKHGILSSFAINEGF